MRQGQCFVANLLEDAVHLSEMASPKCEESHARDMVDLFGTLRGMEMDFEPDRDIGRDIPL